MLSKSMQCLAALQQQSMTANAGHACADSCLLPVVLNLLFVASVCHHRTLLVANRLKGFADALELSAVKSSCATKDTRLGQFNALIMTYGVSSAAELGEVLKLSKASCRQHALAATVYRGLWRATRTR